jgi:predicted transcriptional regulator
MNKYEQKLLEEELERTNGRIIEQKDVLLSIKPKYAKLIKQGKKRWEYRKLIWTNNKLIDKIFLYETSPIKKITGFFTTNLIITAKPKEIWALTHQKAGVSQKEFFEYFKLKRKKRHAIQISNLHLFELSQEPKRLISHFHAPQNFMYVNIDLDDIRIKKREKKEFIGGYISEELKQDLLTLAEKQERSQIYIIKKLLKEGLKTYKTHPPLKPLRTPNLNGPPKQRLNSNSATHIQTKSTTKIPPLTEERKRLIEEIKKGVELAKTSYCKECKKRYSEEECPYCNTHMEGSNLK